MKNELSAILYKYKDVANYEDIKNVKLKYSVKAHLNGKLHMDKLYLDNAPVDFRWQHNKMENINGFLYKWSVKNQEDFISNSEWFKTEIRPLIVYDYTNNVNKYADIEKSLFDSLFGNDIDATEFSGQFLFTNIEEERCLPCVLMFVLLYWNEVDLNKIFELVKRYYPVKYSKNNLDGKIVLQLVRWRRKGYLFCRDLRFSAKKKFFVEFLKEYGKR